MIARATLALFALAAVRAHAQFLQVDVIPNTEEPEEVQMRYTPELTDQLKAADENATLLYTVYTAKAAIEMKSFIKNISRLTNDTIVLDPYVWDSAPDKCRIDFKKRLNKIILDAERAASFSGENHHKFFLGHMIVFRMHLNKSKEYIEKCDKFLNGCGSPCETMKKIKHWRRQAMNEIHRVKDDLEHSRRFYDDFLLHARRKLNTLRKRAKERAEIAVEELQFCAKRQDAGDI